MIPCHPTYLHPPHVHHAADTNLNRNSSFLTKIFAFIIGQTFTALLNAHFESFRILFPISARMESRSHIQTLPVYHADFQKTPHLAIYPSLIQTVSEHRKSMHAFCRSYIGTYRPDYLLSYTLQQACQVSRIAGVTHAIDFFHMQVHMLNRIKLIPCRISSRRKQKRKGLWRLARDIAARHTRIAPTIEYTMQ